MSPPIEDQPQARRLRLTGEERREQLLDAAMRLFGQQGFAATTIRDIATAAAVTDGLIYRYFASKEELLLEVVAIARRELLAITAVDLDQPVQQTIRTVMLELATRLRANMSFVMVWSAHQASSERVLELDQLHEEAYRRIADILHHYDEQGDLVVTDEALCARLLMGTTFGFVAVSRRLSDSEWPSALNTWVDFASDVIVNGIGRRD